MIVFFELPLALLERQAISSADVFCHKHTIKAIHVNLLSSSLSVAFSGRWWTESIHLSFDCGGGDFAFTLKVTRNVNFRYVIILQGFVNRDAS